MPTDLKAGTRVQREYKDEQGTLHRECGIVVHVWTDPETGEQDAYIAFFGSEFPEGKPDGKPYVLRYFASGLEVVA